jgi:hypothetical protein
MERTFTIVQRALRARQLSEGAALEIERRGEEAFVEIAAALGDGSAPDRLKVNALRLMSRTTRQFYPKGKLELISWASRLALDPSQAVRNAACHTAILALVTMEALPALAGNLLEARSTARKAVAAALEAGMDARETTFATRFMVGRGWTRPTDGD